MDLSTHLQNAVSIVFWPVDLLDSIIIHPASSTSFWDVLLILLIMSAFLALIWRNK